MIPARTGFSWRLDDRIEPFTERLNLTLAGFRALTRRRVLFQSTYLTSLPVPVPQVAVALDLNHEILPHLYQDNFGLWLRRRYPAYVGHARRVIAISNATKLNLVKFYGTDPGLIDVVHLATDPATYFLERQERVLADLTHHYNIRPPYLLYVGVHSSTFKNFGTLLQAFVDSARHTRLSLVIAGPPWDSQEQEQLHRLPPYAKVQLVPDPDESVLRALYNFATAFVYPSLAEGFGIPLLEAMACGSPIIASDIPVFHEVAGDAAMYFEPNDSDQLGKAIERCLDGAVRDEHITRGLRQVTRFSWDKAAVETRAVYEKALG